MSSLEDCPYRVFRATGKTVCPRCLTLDGQCFTAEEAQRIEKSLGCSCPHEWGFYEAFNNAAITDHAKAGWGVDLSAHGIPCPELCPSDLLALVQALEDAEIRLQNETEKINRLFYGSERDDVAEDEATFWHNVKMSEGLPFQGAQREVNRAQRAIWNYVENLLRDSQGLPRIGEGWVNETRLFHIVEGLFPDDEVIHHYRAPWLGRLELDVYVKGAHIGFEYQGIQHFEPVDHWGGEEAFERGQERDAEKRRLCEAHGVNLIEIRYDEELSEDLIRGKLCGKPLPRRAAQKIWVKI